MNAMRQLSISSRRPIMEMTGFSETQRDVHESINKICSRFSDDYWAERDETGQYPHELHAALAKDGW